MLDGSNDADSHKDVPFGVLLILHPIGDMHTYRPVTGQTAFM